MWNPLLALLASLHTTQGFARLGRGPGFIARRQIVDLSGQGWPGVPNTTLHWYDQDIDHFSWGQTPTGETTFRQRFFVFERFWVKGGPLFFYCGNEANVELYVNSTGLMWESAEQFGAALIFAEHRYYGESKPFGEAMRQHLAYLTMEQALADYATLIYELKRMWATETSSVIAFGGSYGGMLAAWLRMKYPGSVDGAIAASAPILAFHGLVAAGKAFGDGEAYWQVVTRDATEAAGCDGNCALNVRQAWDDLFALGHTARGRQKLAALFRLCGESPLRTEADILNLALMHLNAWDTMAMGNFPYPSNYLVYQQTHDPSVTLPAYPVRAACLHLKENFSNPDERLASLRDATAVFYNASGTEGCFALPEDQNFDGIWDYQWCTEMLPQETYFSRNGKDDMFWPYAQNMTAIRSHCMKAFGVQPRETWITREFAGTAGASNIVFSNGQYDPWSSGGVMADVSESAISVVIPHGAHHLDLMFSDPRDTDDVKEARTVELKNIRKWINKKVIAVRGSSGSGSMMDMYI